GATRCPRGSGPGRDRAAARVATGRPWWSSPLEQSVVDSLVGLGYLGPQWVPRGPGPSGGGEPLPAFTVRQKAQNLTGEVLVAFGESEDRKSTRLNSSHD